VRDVLIVDSEKVHVRLFQRRADGTWPDDGLEIARDAQIPLASIDLQLAAADLYTDTRLQF
jgi:Uma2 family endonuclease